MTDCLTVMCAASADDEAATIARALIEQREAACVQLFPIESFYRWDDATQQNRELMLLIKTTRSRLMAVKETIGRLHRYELPEISALPIVDGTPDYLDWIRSSVALEA